ncbi:MAG: hypothetical protein IKZ87_03975 [Actinomycetaceae bacterium]|nr:hypothetical protein [Actinomycetaceae bacterium]
MNAVKAEALKLLRTPNVWLACLFIAVIGWLVVGYGRLRGFVFAETALYTTIVLGVLSPLVLSLIAAFQSENERKAGSVFWLLSSPHRVRNSLATIAVGMCVFACGIILGLIPLAFHSVSVAFLLALILIASGIALYIVHLWLGLSYGLIATVALGVAESALSPILLTALGDKVWHYIPAAWQARTSVSYLMVTQADTTSEQYTILYHDLATFIPVYILVTVTVIVLFCLWITKWNGNKN